MATTSPVNPLYARLTQNARWPSLRATLLLTIVLTLVSTLLAAYWLSSTESLLAAEAAARQAQGGPLLVQAMTWYINPLPSILGTFLVLPGALLTLMPITIILAATIVTAREDGDREAYQLLHLALPPQAIVHGLMLAILHRVRILCALTLALMPFLVVSPYQKAQAVARYGGCYVFITPEEADHLFQAQEATGRFSIDGHECADPSDNRFLLEALFKATRSAIASWGMSLLGLALAVGLTRWWRRALPVLLFFAAIPITLAALSLALGPTLGPLASMCTNTCTYLAVWPPRVTDLLWPPIPYSLAWGCTLLTCRSA